MGVIENEMFKKIFGPKRDKLIEECRKLHNAKLHALYSSPNVIMILRSTRMRWTGHVARMEQSRDTYRILVRKTEGKKPLERQSHR